MNVAQSANRTVNLLAASIVGLSAFAFLPGHSSSPSDR